MTVRDPVLDEILGLLTDSVGARLTAYADDDTVTYTAPLAPQYRIDPERELLYVRPLIEVPHPGEPFDLAVNRSRNLNLPSLTLEQDDHGRTIAVFDQDGQRVTIARGDEDTSWAVDLWGDYLDTLTSEQVDAIHALAHSYQGEDDPDDLWRT